MKFKDFLDTIKNEEPPNELNDYLKALWYDKKGNWEKAHSSILILTDSKADWLHAYLHRKEGDLNNASYWYRKANRSKPAIPLDEEWHNLVKYFLGNE
ncbi:MAG: hypothetical protein KJ571_06050 [Bacteroidetes bacterium]|nr:hypothetical protein [Bacteroidota bacterium]